MDFSGVVPPADGPESPMAGQISQSRKRGIGRTACSRCKTRKQKCDGQLPVCSNCTKSRATCDLQNVRGEDLVVAKYIHALENKVAELEIQLLQHQPSQAERSDARTPSSGTPGQMSIADVANSLCLSLPDTSSGMEFSQFALHLALNIGDVSQASATTDRSSTGDTSMSEEHLESSAARNYPFTNVVESGVNGTGLPSDELGVRLIKTYSERVDSRYSFLDLDEIMQWHQDRETLFHISLKSLTASQQFGLFKLYLVYAVGSGLLSLTEKQASLPTPEAFYAMAIRHISVAREPRSIENIEAMVLLVIFHLRSSISQELWYLIGFAMRTCIHLGMYLSRREVDLLPAVVQKRRKLFWTVYSLERNISIALGYPVSLPDRLIDVEMPTLMREDDHKLRQVIHLFRLRRIESRIHHSLYRIDRTLQELLPKVRGYYQELQEWKESLLGSVCLDNNNKPDYLLLHYHRAIRLLMQPFLSILLSSDPYFKACLDSAGQICQLHKKLHQNAAYGHSFIAVQTVFVSGIMMLYCLWTHKSVWSVRLSNNIRACSSVLFVMGERTPWVRRYRDAFEALVTMTMERLETQQECDVRDISNIMEEVPMQNTGVPPLGGTQSGGNVVAGFPAMEEPGPPQGEPMPPALQVLQDRWMEFDTMAVVDELVTWVDPNTPPAETSWIPGYGSLGDTSWEAWQLP
ncbi:Transcription factor [Penicillium concentricum]|uniref:Transcription factor n=1 Tax=Penicillium concentricum TaxID=293559 RepID=A0A9W9STC9_9EURO|nr:Transcription factor [Penicillium concentricum]KAJ5384257.1 Transcription factor [Penicillium concentricum]